MTNDPTPTGGQCDRLADPDTQRPCLPYRPPSHASGRRFRALLPRRPIRKPHVPTTDDLLISLFGAPQGAGLSGPGAEGLERAALVEAIACPAAISQVVIEYADLYRLLGGAIANDLQQALGARLYLAEALEDAVEHIECNTDPSNGTDAQAIETPALAWFAAPRQHSDVVHHVLQTQRTPTLIALICGPWAYGPTHLIEADGPWRPPRRTIELLSAQEAVTRLSQKANPSS
ncbi:hypothetical protein [Actinomadura nitritigenes]|uniref:hypothetical protein n=1 Tax=Actinomadura nitritigenes TaxID=134602 RepID=UPI003D8D72F7